MNLRKLIETSEDLRSLDEGKMADSLTSVVNALVRTARSRPVSGETIMIGAVRTGPAGDEKPASEDALRYGRLAEDLAGAVATLGRRLVQLKASTNDGEELLCEFDIDIRHAEAEKDELEEEIAGMPHEIDALKGVIDFVGERIGRLERELRNVNDQLEDRRSRRGDRGMGAVFGSVEVPEVPASGDRRTRQASPSAV